MFSNSSLEGSRPTARITRPRSAVVTTPNYEKGSRSCFIWEKDRKRATCIFQLLHLLSVAKIKVLKSTLVLRRLVDLLLSAREHVAAGCFTAGWNADAYSMEYISIEIHVKGIRRKGKWRMMSLNCKVSDTYQQFQTYRDQLGRKARTPPWSSRPFVRRKTKFNILKFTSIERGGGTLKKKKEQHHFQKQTWTVVVG